MRKLAIFTTAGTIVLLAPLIAAALSYYPYSQTSYYGMQLYWCGSYYSYSPCTSGNYTYHNFSPYTYINNTYPSVNVNATAYASAAAYAYPYSNKQNYYPYHNYSYPYYYYYPQNYGYYGNSYCYWGYSCSQSYYWY